MDPDTLSLNHASCPLTDFLHFEDETKLAPHTLDAYRKTRWVLRESPGISGLPCLCIKSLRWIKSSCLIQCDRDVIRFITGSTPKNWNLIHKGLSIKIYLYMYIQYCEKIYNKYCLTVCSKNNMKYLFQMLYFLPHIEYLCMHGCCIWDDWKLRWEFPDDVIIQLIVDWSGGVVRMWFNRLWTVSCDLW